MTGGALRASLSPYHAGERAVQDRAGVRDLADAVGRGIRPTIPPGLDGFVGAQPLVVVAGADAAGRVWASPLVGDPGFVRAIDEQTLRVAAAPAPRDPLAPALTPGAAAGLLMIDLATRRRLRINGMVAAHPAGTLIVRAAQVYANCPTYIQKRAIASDVAIRRAGAQALWSGTLTTRQRRWVSGADTFFIATAHPQAGADASHRGGPPGFVRVVDARTLVFPDYPGNAMFNTLGNLAADPRAGLLFIDGDRGDTLHLTGRARVVWGDARAVTGTERLVEFTLGEAIHLAGACPLRWRFVAASPFNPT